MFSPEFAFQLFITSLKPTVGKDLLYKYSSIEKKNSMGKAKFFFEKQKEILVTCTTVSADIYTR